MNEEEITAKGDIPEGGQRTGHTIVQLTNKKAVLFGGRIKIENYKD